MNFIYILINSDYHQKFVNVVKSKSSLDSDKRIADQVNKLWKESKIKIKKKFTTFLETVA